MPYQPGSFCSIRATALAPRRFRPTGPCIVNWKGRYLFVYQIANEPNFTLSRRSSLTFHIPCHDSLKVSSSNHKCASTNVSVTTSSAINCSFILWLFIPLECQSFGNRKVEYTVTTVSVGMPTTKSKRKPMKGKNLVLTKVTFLTGNFVHFLLENGNR